MRRAALLLLLPILCAAASNPPPGPAEIAGETSRTKKIGRRLFSAWWLPVEYWVASARELRKGASQIDEVRSLLQSYVVIALIDATIQADGTMHFATLEDTSARIALVRNGKEISPPPRIDPGLPRILPELSYFMTVSLGPLGRGLRLVMLPNIDDQGRPLTSGSIPGDVEVRYRPKGEAPIGFSWKAPLTSVVGPTRCPRGGEDLQASWRYCPWHGVPLE